MVRDPLAEAKSRDLESLTQTFKKTDCVLSTVEMPVGSVNFVPRVERKSMGEPILLLTTLVCNDAPSTKQSNNIDIFQEQ